MRRIRHCVLVAAGCLALTTVLTADTLVLRDGRRLQGQLVSARDGVIDFEVRRGLFGRERVRFERLDVERIEFDRDGRGDVEPQSPSGDQPEGRPSGMRERDVTVPADTAWRDTGVTVRAGQTIYFSASGRVRWGPGRQDGPGGERNSPRNDARPIASRPGAALIGRIGDTDDYFFIGDDEGPIRVRGNGRLYLGINDDFLSDNSGAFRVTVYY